MKLYFTPGACSLAPHIAAREAGLDIELVKVDLATHRTEQGEDFYKINPRGYVPALDVGSNGPITEASVIVQYLADLAPSTELLPAPATLARIRAQQWLAFIATELHKGFSPLWNPATPEATREAAIAAIKKRFAELDTELASKPYLLGDSYSVADIYAYVILRWTRLHGISMDEFKNLGRYAARIEERPAVEAALAYEGLPKFSA